MNGGSAEDVRQGKSLPFSSHNLISEDDMSRYLIQPVKPLKKKGDGDVSSSSSSERRKRNKS